MPDFICPVCGKLLSKNEKMYFCSSGHNFDISKKGYVNLLMSSAKGRHGDDKMMVRARRDFLDKGYYDRLSQALCDMVLKYSEKSVSIIDCGCGECKYTMDILNKLKNAGICPDISGIDISKEALYYGAGRSKDVRLAVASSAKLPFESCCADMVICIFSPFVPEEFGRVLKPGGKIIKAYPLERHLWELKKLIYEKPYENKRENDEQEGFEILEREEVKYMISLDSNEDIENLFKMTPYYYKTGFEDQKKAEAAQSLDVSLEFGITVYEKI